MEDINIGDLKVGGCPRKSSDYEDRQVQSIETQIRELTDLGNRLGFHIAEQHMYAETKSAFTPGRERFNQAVFDVEQGRINALAAVHANRLARNPVDAGIIINLMDRKKLIAIITPTKVYRNNPTDKMMLAIEFIFSKKDSDDKSEFVKNGLKTKALKGLPSGVASIGFLNDFSNEKGNRKWKIDPDRYTIVQALLRRFLERNISASRLYKVAVSEYRLTTPAHKRIGGALISRSRMFTILKDPIYAGFFVQNNVRYDLDPALPRMITEDEHYDILRILGGRHMPKTKKYLGTYTGFMVSTDGGFIGQDPKLQVICDCGKKFAYLHRDRCPACNVRIEAMQHPKYLAYTFYYNVSRKKSGKQTKHLNERKIDAFISDYAMTNFTISKELAEWSRKYLHLLKDKEIRERHLITSRHANIKTEIENKKSRYREMLANGYITPEEYRTDVERLEASVPSSADEALAERWLERASEIVDLTQEFVSIMQTGTIEAKRRILSKLGSNIVWDEQKLSVVNKKSVQALIDGLNRAKRKTPQFEPENNKADKDETEVFASVRPSLLLG